MASSRRRPPFRPGVGRIAPYRVSTPPHEIKLNQNESAVELPAALRRKILRRLTAASWNRYPEYPARRLEAAIADHLGLATERVAVGHASNELIYAMVHATVDKGRAIVVPAPSYPVVKLAARLAGGSIREVSLGEDFSYDVDALVRAVRRHRPRLVFLPSPNNPTGSTLDRGAVRAVVEATRSLVVVDEAYHEFSGIDLRPLLRRHRNLVLLRTLSKAYRLAALRIGFIVGDPEVVSLVERAKPPHSIDLFAQIAGEALFEDPSVVDVEIARVVRARVRLAESLERLPGTRVFPSGGNFLLVKFADATMVYERLLHDGLLVRDVGTAASAPTSLRGCLRLTVGTSRENRALLESVRGAVEG